MKAFPGNWTLISGECITIYRLFTIPHNWFSDPAKKTLMTKFETKVAVEVASRESLAP